MALKGQSLGRSRSGENNDGTRKTVSKVGNLK